MSGRHIHGPAAFFAGGIGLQGEQLLHAVRQPVRGRVKRIVVRRVIQAVLPHGPGVLDIHHHPHGSAGAAPALVAQTAEEILVLLNVQRHALENIQGHVRLLQHGRVFHVFFLRFQLQTRLDGVGYHQPVAHGVAKSRNALGVRFERIHVGDSFPAVFGMTGSRIVSFCTVSMLSCVPGILKGSRLQKDTANYVQFAAARRCMLSADLCI